MHKISHLNGIIKKHSRGVVNWSTFAKQANKSLKCLNLNRCPKCQIHFMKPPKEKCSASNIPTQAQISVIVRMLWRGSSWSVASLQSNFLSWTTLQITVTSWPAIVTWILITSPAHAPATKTPSWSICLITASASSPSCSKQSKCLLILQLIGPNHSLYIHQKTWQRQAKEKQVINFDRRVEKCRMPDPSLC